MGHDSCMEGRKPTRWHAPDVGAECAYLVKFPKYK
jgi:hypothetical protein